MLELPYGNTSIPFDETGARVLRSRTDELFDKRPGETIVRAAMARPYGGANLCELAAGKRTCTLIVSDHTRPVPSRDILPPMLEELRTGNPEIQITLLVATGCHRGTTRAELTQKLGGGNRSARGDCRTRRGERRFQRADWDSALRRAACDRPAGGGDGAALRGRVH